MLLRCSKAALLVLAVTLASSSNASAQTQLHKTVLVPERVAVLVRPILDGLQHYQQHRHDGADRSQVDERFYSLIKQKGPAVDEALVVLMCFEVMGESQEETDEVIARGHRMLPYIQKYRDAEPKLPARSYSDLLKGLAAKDNAFEGAPRPSSTAGAVLGTIQKGSWRNILITLKMVGHNLDAATDKKEPSDTATLNWVPHWVALIGRGRDGCCRLDAHDIAGAGANSR